MLRLVTRPLLIIFLTIFVNLVGFGIIIPLLPFYAETFGASPLVIGLLFAVFSLCQLLAAPALGDLSDRYGRRPILIFSLAGTVVSFVMLAVAHSIAMLFAARIVDGLSGGNISTARAYVADITEPKDRARAYGIIGAAFGLGFILGPALSGILSGISYTAPIWAAAGLTAGRDGDGVVVAARDGAPRAGRHRQSVQLSAGSAAATRRSGGFSRSTSSTGWRSRRSRRPSRCSSRGASASACRRPGTSLPRSACSARVIQGGFIRPVVKRLGDKPTFLLGLGFGALGLVAAALAHSVALFAIALVPLALGIGFGHPTMSSLVSLVARGDEQGRVQGAASAVESLGRTIGPVWGNASLQHYGESTPYISAAALLLLTFLLSVGFHVSESGDAPRRIAPRASIKAELVSLL